MLQFSTFDMNVNAHKTKKELISTFLKMTDDDSVSKIKVDDLLKAAGVSKGSLYHHFVDFDDLAAEANAHAFSSEVDNIIDLFDGVLGKSETVEEFETRFRAAILDMLTPDGLERRLTAAKINGASSKSTKLRNHISLEQQRLTLKIEQAFIGAQHKGVADKSFAPHFAAVLIQAYLFGKIIDDLSQAPVNPNDWADWMVNMVSGRKTTVIAGR
jgi:AcrR family transcriptional regulator